MKPLLTALAILMIGCDGLDDIQNKNYPLVIESISKYGSPEKYRLRVKNLNKFLYTDSLYQIGDTLIITKK